MADDPKPKEKASDDEPALKVEPERINEPEAPTTPVVRRRLRPAAVLGGIGVLVAVGVGLYLAWPEIVGKDEPPAPSAPSSIAETTPSPPIEEPAPSPPVEAGTEPSPPVESSAPPVEVPGPSIPSEGGPGTTTPAPPSSEPSEAEKAALAQIESLKARLAAMEEEAARRGAEPEARPADDAALQALNARLDALEQRPAEAVATPAAPSEREAEFAARIAQLEARLATAEAGAAEAAAARSELAAMKANAQALTDKLAVLEKGAAEDSWLIGLVAAKAALAQAAQQGQKLAHLLADLRILLRGDAAFEPMLVQLDAFARQSAPTYEALRLRFPEVARLAVRAAREPDPEAGWIDQTAARLGSIVTVRKTRGELEPGSLDERLVNAERALDAGDGPSAVAALEGVKGGTEVEAFRADLARRVVLDAAVREVEKQIAAKVGAHALPSAAPASNEAAPGAE